MMDALMSNGQKKGKAVKSSGGTYITKCADLRAMLGKTNTLQASVVLTVTGLRIIAGLLTLLIRWRKRKQMMQIMAGVFRLSPLDSPYKKPYRWWLLLKIFTASVVFLLHVAQTVQIIDSQNIQLNLRLFMMSWTFFITNLAVLQYFLILLFFRTKYQIINEKLKKVVRETGPSFTI
ncbi:putative gustatory receptor 36b [Drosophila biarmipes]|uniref:putative gustatory receptor 36b n=1 Tax=Drosophila biarmipes TaxID=125945 RepID=UPI0021CC677B|nr:putative gustatory receptor 36b [Drosophila biarmipes]